MKSMLKKPKNKAVFVFGIACFFALFLCVFSVCAFVFFDNTAYAADKSEEEIKKEFNDTVDEVISGLDLKALQDFLNSLDGDADEALSIDDVKDTLKALVGGNPQGFYEKFMSLLSKSAGRYFL